MPTPRYAETTYSGTLAGSKPTGYTNADAPWAIGSTRVDGVTTEGRLSPIVPGQTVVYECVFRNDPIEAADGHIQRARTLANYLPYAADVLTFDPPGLEVYYREQYEGPSSLVRIAPLRVDHDASWVDGDPPPGRDSIHYGRWAVVTGGEFAAPLGAEADASVQLETVSIAATEAAAEAPHYETREAALSAAERNTL